MSLTPRKFPVPDLELGTVNTSLSNWTEPIPRKRKIYPCAFTGSQQIHLIIRVEETENHECRIGASWYFAFNFPRRKELFRFRHTFSYPILSLKSNMQIYDLFIMYSYKQIIGQPVRVVSILCEISAEICGPKPLF